jgi:hypothetical protein
MPFFHLEIETGSSGRFGHMLDTARIFKSSTVKNDLFDFSRPASGSNEPANRFGSLGFIAFFNQAVTGGEKCFALRVVNDLRVDKSVGSKNRQARAPTGALNLGPDLFLQPYSFLPFFFHW